jgi:hypothetical protein
LRQKWISNVTQVPSVVGMVSQTFSDVFPSPHPDARQSFAHLQLARGIMSRHRAVFGVGEEAASTKPGSSSPTLTPADRMR